MPLIKKLVYADLRALPLIAGIVVFILAKLFRGYIIFHFGISSAGFILNTAYLLLAIGTVTMITYTYYKVQDAKRQKLISRQHQELESSLSLSKDHLPEATIRTLLTNLKDGKMQQYREGFDQCLSMMTDMDDRQEKLNKLFKLNKVDYLDQITQALDDAEQYMFRNFIAVINHGMVEATDTGEIINKAIAANNEVLHEVDNLLSNLADFISDKARRSPNEIATWVEVIKDSIKKGGKIDG